jgi:HlyD family secretion protein
MKRYQLDNSVLTEIVSGVPNGLVVLTDFSMNKEQEGPEAGEQASNPFMPRPRGNRNNQKK